MCPRSPRATSADAFNRNFRYVRIDNPILAPDVEFSDVLNHNNKKKMRCQKYIQNTIEKNVFCNSKLEYFFNLKFFKNNFAEKVSV